MQLLHGRKLHAAVFAALALSLGPVVSAQSTSVGSGYWHTGGNQILDSQGNAVRLAGVNWYGFETPDFLAHGLWAQDYKTVLNNLKALGYNVIRMPFSNQMVESNPVPTNFTMSAGGVPANTALVGQTALQDMDTIIAYAGSIGLRVILDNHRSEAGASNEQNGLWYTSAFPHSSWVADWQTMAMRYSDPKFTFNGNPTVIGMDLRNEPHVLAGGNRTGACWTGDTATAGCPTSNTAQNWPVAATEAGDAILAINPHLLMFVEGNDCFGSLCGWQGGNLIGVATHPITLSVPNQLVYSAHDYGPNLFQQPWFNSNTTATSLASIWNQYWGYISAGGTAPIWLGEFGTTNNSADIEGTGAGSQGQWFQTLTSFLKSNPAISWTYWAMNGEDNYALLDSNYDATPASALKQSLLQPIQFPLGGGVVSNPGFSLSPAAASMTVTAGGSAVTDNVIITRLGGFTGSVALTASGLPTGVTTSFSPNPTTNGSTVLTLMAASTAAARPFTLTLTGTSGTLMASSTITVAVGSATTTGGGSCHIGYTITNQWNTGFQVAITINNTSTTPISGWTLTWAFPNGQTVTQLWNGIETQSGANVTVTNEPYNANIPAGGSYSAMGFTGTWNGSTNSVPTSFSVNGTACN
jgi:endoglucanase